ncbi:hypothetical protein ACQR16_16360 [Bradyrhizobium oligotrophicum]|uniref:hypothetical protein n=1 Tax=Bradyrhizobium oligotrophicum TaxID=44255 RepID=UPI003EBF520B
MTTALLIGTSNTALAAQTANDKAVTECAAKAKQESNQANLERYKQQGLDLSIAGVLATRRATEGYCARFVIECLKLPEIAQGGAFQNCLDDEDEDRLNDAKSLRRKL